MFSLETVFCVFLFFNFLSFPFHSQLICPQMTLTWPRRTGAAAPMTPRACACFQMAPGKQGAGGPAGSGGAKGSCVRAQEGSARRALGAARRRRAGLLRVGKTSRVQFWRARHLHPSLKAKPRTNRIAATVERRSHDRPPLSLSLSAGPVGCVPSGCLLCLFLFVCLFGPSLLGLQTPSRGAVSLSFPPGRAGLSLGGGEGGPGAGVARRRRRWRRLRGGGDPPVAAPRGLHCTLVCSPWCGGGVSALTVPTCE